jgi:hypothetical protein
MGQILQAGQGQLTARQAAAKAGIPLTTPPIVLNKLCLPGINAIYLADQMTAAGDADIVVAGGMESMTRAPYLLQDARSGYRRARGLDAVGHLDLFARPSFDGFGDRPVQRGPHLAPATTALDKELNELGVCATSLTQDISNDGYDTFLTYVSTLTPAFVGGR